MVVGSIESLSKFNDYVQSILPFGHEKYIHKLGINRQRKEWTYLMVTTSTFTRRY